MLVTRPQDSEVRECHPTWQLLTDCPQTIIDDYKRISLWLLTADNHKIKGKSVELNWLFRACSSLRICQHFEVTDGANTDKLQEIFVEGTQTGKRRQENSLENDDT